MKRIFYFLLVLLVLCFFVFMSRNKDSFVSIGGEKVKVEVVSTPEARAQGLSGRPSLEAGHGMLFVFDYPDSYSFWMKDMNFPIDMIWFDQDFKITYIKKNAEPASYPEAFGPKEKTSKYVLEVSSGFADAHSLEAGDKAEFILTN